MNPEEDHQVRVQVALIGGLRRKRIKYVRDMPRGLLAAYVVMST